MGLMEPTEFVLYKISFKSNEIRYTGNKEFFIVCILQAELPTKVSTSKNCSGVSFLFPR